ncbi:MAG: superoxide dismutase family protein [Pirellulaceae bacterium]
MLKPFRCLLVAPLCLAALLSATQAADDPKAKSGDKHHDAADKSLPKEGVAVLMPTADNEARGVVLFKEMDGMVYIKGKVINLTPGKHGFHIHMYGDLRAADGTSAGGHYDPDGHPHGGPDDQEHHAGDLGNIVANEDGVAMIDMKTKSFKLHFVIGRAVVVHGGVDDLKSQPSGDAGPRVAVGVVGFSNLETKSDK